MKELEGTGVALITPFNKEGTVDFDGLRNLLNFIKDHVDYYVVHGTTGEAATTTADEKKEILDFVKANNPNKLPVVVGIGGNNTAAILDNIKSTDFSGTSALLSVSPYYNKPSQRGIIAHYETIADASPVPVILYNVPGRTGSNLAVETTLTLAQHPNIIGVKEASGDISQCMRIATKKPEDFLLISGDDVITGPMIACGGNGVISVLANGFPVEMTGITSAALKGDFAESNKWCHKLLDINPLMFEESNPVGIKEVLKLKKVCGNQVRLPLVAASEALSQRIAEKLKRA